MGYPLVNVTFEGGEENGRIIENVQVRRLPKEFYFHCDIYFAENPSGGMNIMKGKLNSFWHSYDANYYVRKPTQDKLSGTIIYTFLENRMIERCAAITKKQTRCMKAAIHEKLYCSTHNH